MSKRLLPLVPANLVVEQVVPTPDHLTVMCRSRITAPVCPGCGHPSSRRHSSYPRRLFTRPPPASSNKSMIGHCLSAGGALEAVATVMALRDGVLPPTANFREADPECDLDMIPNTARVLPIQAALSNSFAFGGLNAVLAFKAAASA